MQASVSQGRVPGWVREPEREVVREMSVPLHGVDFRLHFRGRELLELTRLVGDQETIVDRDSEAWALFAMDVSLGAFEEGD